MPSSPSTGNWKPFDGKLEALSSSGQFSEVPRSHWPAWAAQGNQFKRIGVFGLQQASTSLQASLPSVASVVALLLTERLDPKDAPKDYNYNFYVVAESTDGSLYQSGPIISTDPRHHSSSPSTWFNALSSPTSA